MDIKDRLLPAVVEWNEDMRAAAISCLDDQLLRHRWAVDVPPPVRRFGDGTSFGRWQQRRVGLHAILGKQAFQDSFHLWGKSISGGHAPCSPVDAKTLGPKSTMVVI